MSQLKDLARRIRSRLRPKLRNSTVGNSLSSAEQPVRDVEVITNLDRLDEKLAEIDAAWVISDDAVREVFQGFRMEITPPRHSDPWSQKYADAQFDLYHRISARPGYSTNNEVSGFDVDPKRPFPYYTESFSTVGDQFLAIGYLIKTMGLPAGSEILEFGPGWGNTTIALAQMGYRMTALDIDPNFVQLIRDRAELFGLDVDARIGAFLDTATMDDEFDAVLFYECFHHCSDHVQLLRDLHRVVKPEGKVVLAAEPIFDGFHAPWGLRLDGESLWAIRQNGWLELGFTESYFIETCLRQGWTVTRESSDVSPLTVIFTLRQVGNVIQPGAIRLPPADESAWGEPDFVPTGDRYALKRSRLVCPMDQGWEHFNVRFINRAPHDLAYLIRHGASVERGQVPRNAESTVTVAYHADAGEIQFESDTWRPSKAIAGSLDGRLLGLAVASVEFS